MLLSVPRQSSLFIYVMHFNTNISQLFFMHGFVFGTVSFFLSVLYKFFIVLSVLYKNTLQLAALRSQFRCYTFSILKEQFLAIDILNISI